MPGEGKGKTAPARLFVHLAREAPVGVVLRRGPTDWAQIILWHTDTDTFEYGQWFHGRIYDRTCDISPDGTLLVYGARDYRERDWHDPDNKLWEWIALSRPPYLTALTLWKKMADGYYGGGYFADENTLYLYGEETETEPTSGRIPPFLKVERLLVAKSQGIDVPATESLNGWRLIQQCARQYPGPRTLKAEILGKDRERVTYSLIQSTEDFHHYKYSLRDQTTGKKINLDDVTWADLDHRDRIAFARDGKLYVIEVAGTLESAHEIADFNDQRFTPVVAPEWAQHW